MWASATFHEVLYRMVTFDSLLNDGCCLTFTNDEKFAIFSLFVHQGEEGALVSEPNYFNRAFKCWCQQTPSGFCFKSCN
jgi:hypothetical protein